MNKHKPHVYVIPEDDRDRQIAEGFVVNYVNPARIQVMPPARGWPNVLKTYEAEYVQTLRNNPRAHVVMLIDFDGHPEKRRARFERAIAVDLKERVFLVGPRDNPETLKKALRLGFEEIGARLAEDCTAGTPHWDHDQLQHNDAERRRLIRMVGEFHV